MRQTRGRSQKCPHPPNTRKKRCETRSSHIPPPKMVGTGLCLRPERKAPRSNSQLQLVYEFCLISLRWSTFGEFSQALLNPIFDFITRHGSISALPNESHLRVPSIPFVSPRPVSIPSFQVQTKKSLHVHTFVR